jgi:hypothetical protein
MKYFCQILHEYGRDCENNAENYPPDHRQFPDYFVRFAPFHAVNFRRFVHAVQVSGSLRRLSPQFLFFRCGMKEVAWLHRAYLPQTAVKSALVNNLALRQGVKPEPQYQALLF